MRFFPLILYDALSCYIKERSFIIFFILCLHYFLLIILNFFKSKYSLNIFQNHNFIFNKSKYCIEGNVICSNIIHIFISTSYTTYIDNYILIYTMYTVDTNTFADKMHNMILKLNELYLPIRHIFEGKYFEFYCVWFKGNILISLLY